MSKEYIIDSDENSDYMYNVIKNVINEIGPRPAGSENEKRASEWTEKELEKFCDAVEIEDFYCHPRAFLGFTRVCLGILSITILIFFLTSINQLSKLIFSVTSLGITIFVFYIIYKAFLCYEPILAPIFKKKRSQNVVGTIKPTDEIKNRIIFSSHIDSTIYNKLQYTQHGYLFYIMKGLLSIIIWLIIFIFQLINAILGQDLIVFTIIANILIYIFPGSLLFVVFILGRTKSFIDGVFMTITKLASLIILIDIAFSYSVIIFFLFGVFKSNLTVSSLIFIIYLIPTYILVSFFQNKNGSPGATDNLAGVATCLCIAKVLSEWKEKYRIFFPKNSEIKILICGAEEVGLRGSREFSEKYSKEYNKINTTCVNFDNIQYSEYLQFFTREKTTRTNLDKEIVSDLEKIAKNLNKNYIISQMSTLGGGSDGAGLVMGGLRATTIASLHIPDFLHFYHSTRDNLSMVNRERRPCNDHGTSWKNRNVRCAMENALKISLEYIKLVDEK